MASGPADAVALACKVQVLRTVRGLLLQSVELAPRTLDMASADAPARFDWAATDPLEAWRRDLYSDRALYRDVIHRWKNAKEQRGCADKARLGQIQKAICAIDARQAAAGLVPSLVTPAKLALWERARRIRRRALEEAKDEFDTRGFSCQGIVPPRPF